MVEATRIRRTLEVKIRLPNADVKQLLPFVKAAIPFYETLGQVRIRLLHNVDDPTQFVQLVEYETDATMEITRQRFASDPTLRAYLQTWKTFTLGAIEVDVYEDVTGVIGWPGR